MLASERLQLGEAGRAVTYNASGGVVPEAYACMLPLGDTAFITQVSKTLERLMRDGEMETPTACRSSEPPGRHLDIKKALSDR